MHENIKPLQPELVGKVKWCIETWKKIKNKKVKFLIFVIVLFIAVFYFLYTHPSSSNSFLSSTGFYNDRLAFVNFMGNQSVFQNSTARAPDRILSDPRRMDELLKNLPPDKSVLIGINTVGSDPEVYRYADQVQDYLAANSWKTMRISIIPIGAPVLSGVHGYVNRLLKVSYWSLDIGPRD